MPDYDVYEPDGPDGSDGSDGSDELPEELRYRGPWATPTEGTEDENWCVLVEVANGRQEHPPTRMVIVAEDFVHRADAVDEARRQAFEFRPPDPRFPELRQVFEDDDGFVTVIEGKIATYHFRTRVMKLAGVAPR